MAHGSRKTVQLGSLRIGGGNPVMVQSMTNTDTRNVEATLAQISELVARGCEAVRVAVPDDRAADVLKTLHDKSPVPLIADIHFDWRLAVRAIEAGFEGLRINPGNIGSASRVARVVDAARANGAAIRVGVNSGSVERELLDRFGGPCPEAMVASARNHVRLVEERGFDQIVVSVKSSSVLDTIACYRALARELPYPLHVGVTEAGSLMRGTVKSAVGLGVLLSEGIGDTIRVSLTGDPVPEVEAGLSILRAVGLRRDAVDIVSCPTCGRTCIDVAGIVARVRAETAHLRTPLKIAVMGCVVNGPGEAQDADIGIAGGKSGGALFGHGQLLRTVRGDLAQALLEEIRRMSENG